MRRDEMELMEFTRNCSTKIGKTYNNKKKIITRIQNIKFNDKKYSKNINLKNT